MNEQKIKWENIKDGDKIRVEEYYSSYGANEQEYEYHVTAKKVENSMHLIKDDGTEFYHGISSGYAYFKKI